MRRYERNREPFRITLPAAIIIGALLVALIPIAYSEITARLALRELNEASADMARKAQAEARERARKERIRERQAAQATRREQAARRLAPDQRCTGGTVVIQRTSRAGTPSFVQLLENGRPVACTGRTRLEPRR